MKLVNGLLGALCFVVLASDVLATTRELEMTRAFGAPARGRIGLLNAISIAESRADGRAVGAKLVTVARDDWWDVDVLSRGRHVRVAIDVRTGAVSVEPQRAGR